MKRIDQRSDFSLLGEGSVHSLCVLRVACSLGEENSKKYLNICTAAEKCYSE